MDIALFNTQNLNGGFFGNYYFYSVNESLNTETYVVFVNCTS